MIVHHLATRVDWESRTATTYCPSGSAFDGFVHCSFSHQVVTTANRFYRGRHDLLLLTIDTTRCTADLVVEDTAGHGDFPHLYGPVDLVAVVAAAPFPPAGDGGFGWWSPPKPAGRPADADVVSTSDAER